MKVNVFGLLLCDLPDRNARHVDWALTDVTHSMISIFRRVPLKVPIDVCSSARWFLGSPLRIETWKREFF